MIHRIQNTYIKKTSSVKHLTCIAHALYERSFLFQVQQLGLSRYQSPFSNTKDRYTVVHSPG